MCRWISDGLNGNWHVHPGVLSAYSAADSNHIARAAGDGFPLRSFDAGSWDPCTCSDLPCNVSYSGGTLNPELYRYASLPRSHLCVQCFESRWGHTVTLCALPVYSYASALLSRRPPASTFSSEDEPHAWAAYNVELQEEAIALAVESSNQRSRGDTVSLSSHEISCNKSAALADAVVRKRGHVVCTMKLSG